MTDKKELNNEELENVAGGYCDDDGVDKYLPDDHGIHITGPSVQHYIGQRVYVVYDIDRETYYWGTVVSSVPDGSYYTHSISVEGCNDFCMCYTSYVGKTKHFSSYDWTVFSKNN